MATSIVSDFHGSIAGLEAAREFRRVFRDRQAPEQMQELKAKRMGDRFLFIFYQRGDIVEQTGPFEISPVGKERWSKFLFFCNLVGSISEGERLLKQNAIEVNGEVLSEAMPRIDLDAGSEYLVRVGKRKFARIVLE